jgi:antitoxin component of RelBE/YafQ-DinJ toxin-antitoxin module
MAKKQYKDHTIIFRTSQAEKDKLDEMSALTGLTMSQIIRMALKRIEADGSVSIMLPHHY